MVGFMTVTMFLSMWISNTATTAMMMPIVEAVLDELYRSTTDEESQEVQDTDHHVEIIENTDVKSNSNNTNFLDIIIILYEPNFPSFQVPEMTCHLLFLLS